MQKNNLSFSTLCITMLFVSIVTMYLLYTNLLSPQLNDHAEHSEQNSDGEIIFLGQDSLVIDDKEFVMQVNELGNHLLNPHPWLNKSVFGPQEFKTNGKYIHVMLTVNNIGNVSDHFSLNPIGIKDESNRFYSYTGVTSSNCTFNNLDVYSALSPLEVKPGIPCMINYLFEVSSASFFFTLEMFYNPEPKSF